MSQDGFWSPEVVRIDPCTQISVQQSRRIAASWAEV